MESKNENFSDGGVTNLKFIYNYGTIDILTYILIYIFLINLSKIEYLTQIYNTGIVMLFNSYTLYY